MKIPIPSDWEGDWRCVEIQWPNSPMWTSLLLGLIGSPSQGRYWDERTGTIIDAQAIGQEIFFRNFPLKSCRICPDDNGDTNGPQGGGVDTGDDDMGQGVTWLGIEDGILYMYFGPCCKIAVGDLSTVDTPGGEGEPDPDPPSVWSCNKARGMGDQWGAMLRIGIDALQITTPGSVIAAAPYQQAWKNALPSFVYDESILWQAMVWYSTGAQDVEIEAAIEDADFESNLACAWNTQLLNTSGLSVDEAVRMKSSLSSRFSSVVSTFLALMFDATRFPIFSYWAESYYAETGNCDCPEDTGESARTSSGWYLGPEVLTDWTGDGGNAGWAMFRELVGHDVYGLTFIDRTLSGVPDRIHRAGGCSSPPATYDYCMNTVSSEFLDLTGTITYAQTGPLAHAELVAELGMILTLNAPPGNFSDSIPAPVADAGEIVKWVNIYDGNPNPIVGESTCRWLHNQNSPSHS